MNTENNSEEAHVNLPGKLSSFSANLATELFCTRGVHDCWGRYFCHRLNLGSWALILIQFSGLAQKCAWPLSCWARPPETERPEQAPFVLGGLGSQDVLISAPFSWLFQLSKGEEMQGMRNEFQEINMEIERGCLCLSHTGKWSKSKTQKWRSCFESPALLFSASSAGRKKWGIVQMLIN